MLELSSAPYLIVQITSQDISLAAAEDVVMAEEESKPTPQAALFARDGTNIHRQAEQVIALDDTSTAYDQYRELYQEGDDSAFVMERLMQLGLSLPAWNQELGQLLHEQQQKYGEHSDMDTPGSVYSYEQLWKKCRNRGNRSDRPKPLDLGIVRRLPRAI